MTSNFRRRYSGDRAFMYGDIRFSRHRLDKRYDGDSGPGLHVLRLMQKPRRRSENSVKG
jgi:hypothetical protein